METNTATPLNPFSGFSKRSTRYEIDLSECTLIEAVREYEKFKRISSPTYSLSSLVYNLEIVQVLSGGRLYPDAVTDLFYSTFISWLCEKGINYNSIKLYCSQIRAVLTWGIRHRCPVSSTYDQVDVPNYEAYTIALTPDEVSHIAHFDISGLKMRKDKKETLEKVRDHFVLSCNLGQRYSDMKRLTPENFERNLMIVTQQKTGNKARMDINKFAMMPKHVYKLLKKYDYRAPYSGHINNYNNYLHELIQAIGQEFNEECKIEQKVNGKIVTTFKKKGDMIASHTARRTFATYNSLRQIPIAELMHATGHKSMSSLQHYIKFE